MSYRFNRPGLILLLVLLLEGLTSPLVYGQIGDEVVFVDPGFGSVGDEVEIEVGGFPPSVVVSIFIADVQIGTVRTNSAGAGTLTARIPEVPGGEQVVTARAEAQGLIAATTLTVEPLLALRDAAGKLIEADTFILNGAQISITATGFGALEEVTLVDDARGVDTNIVEEGQVRTIAKGTLGVDSVTASGTGAFTLTYQVVLEVATGTIVRISAEGSDPYFTFEDAEFTAGGPPVLRTGFPQTSAPRAEVTISVAADFLPGSLMTDQRYSLLFDGSTLTLDVDGTSTRSFTSDNNTVTFTIPTAATGVHSLAVVFFGAAERLVETAFVVSDEGGTPGAALLTVNPATGLPTAQPLQRTTVDVDVGLALYNFDGGQPVDVSMVTSVGLQTLPGVSADAEGASLSTFSVPATASGRYTVFLEFDTSTISLLLEIAPGLEVDVSEGFSGTTVTLASNGLSPRTSYLVAWDVVPGSTAGGTTVPNSLFVTDDQGAGSVEFRIPVATTGVHYITVAPASDPNRRLVPYTYPAFRIRTALILDPSAEAFPFDVVGFRWDTEEAAGGELIPVFLEIQGRSVLAGLLNSTHFLGSASGASVKRVDTLLVGSFLMPNGAPDENVEVKLTLGDRTVLGSIRRRAGGSLVGPDLASQLAQLRTNMTALAQALKTLDARVVTVQNGLVTLETKLGQTTVKVDDLSANLASLLAALRTGTESIRQDVSTVRAAAGDIKTGLTDLGSDIGTVRRGVSENASYLLILSGLTVAQIIVIVAVLVVVIRKK